MRSEKSGALFSNLPHKLDLVYGAGRKEKLAQQIDLYPHIITSENIQDHLESLKNIDFIFATWGMFPLSDEQLNQLPELKAVFYAAGSVKGFAENYLKRNIRVFSSWAANAIPVAEFSMAQILLSCKQYFRNQQACSNPINRRNGALLPQGPGIFNEKVALIGAGMIGRKVIELLQPFNLEILVVDPYLEPAFADEWGVKIVDLESAFKEAYVVSNHLPNIPATVGILNKKLFNLMRQGSTFINTGRGAQVAENEFIEVLKQRPDITALLDVTYPEPPNEESEFYSLPNVFMSSHIAGSLGNEVVRMADFMLDEFARYQAGDKPEYEVTLEMLETMA